MTSGAERWNQPEKYPWSIGWNVGYTDDEGRLHARYILDNVKNPKIAVLYQNDEFGKAVLSGLKDTLGERVSAIVDAVSYEVSDPTIESPISRLKNTGANVLLSMTTPKFAAQSIRAVDNLGWKPLIILPSVSNSIDPVLTSAGLDKSVGIMSSSYSKQPSDPQWRDAAEFKAWSAFMDKYYPGGSKTDWLNAYGYGMAYAMHQALERAGPNLTRESLMDALKACKTSKYRCCCQASQSAFPRATTAQSSRCRCSASTGALGNRRVHSCLEDRVKHKIGMLARAKPENNYAKRPNALQCCQARIC